jgi:hypothetical protein
MVLITNNKTINEQWIEMNLLAKERVNDTLNHEK